MAFGARGLAYAFPYVLPAALAAQGLLGMDPGLPYAAAADAARVLAPGAGVARTFPSVTDVRGDLFSSFAPLPVTQVPQSAVLLPDAHAFSRLLAAAELLRDRSRGVTVDPQGRIVLARGPQGYARRGVFVTRPRRERARFDAIQLGVDADAPDGTGYTIWFRGVDPATAARAPWTQVVREQEVRYEQPWPAWQVQVVMFTTRADQTPTFTAVVGHPALVGPVAGLLGQGQGAAPDPAPRRGPEPGPKATPPPAQDRDRDRDDDRGHRIIPRAEWGAKPSKDGRTPMKPERFTIHHTASRTKDYDGASSIRGIQAYHQGSQGWSDIGYHYVIGPDGKIFEGRPPETLGAHCIPNTGKVGICLVGNFEAGDEVPDAAADALVWLLARLSRRLGIGAGEKLTGHRDFMQTACPGDKLYRMLPGIQARLRSKL